MIVGLALATALLSGVQAINSEARAAYAQATNLISGPGRVLVDRDGGAIAQSDYIALRRAGWLVSPVIEGSLRWGDTGVRIIGIDPLTASNASPVAQAALQSEDSDLADPTAFLTTPGVLLAAPDTAARLNPVAPAPVRAVDGITPGLVFADVGIVQGLLGRPGELDQLVVSQEQPLLRSELSTLVPHLALRDSDETNDLARLTDSFHLNLTAFGLLSFAVGLFIVHATIGLAFEQRRTLFRTIRALGVSPRSLIAGLVVELLIFAILAGLAGTVLGYVIAAALLPDVAATLRGLYGANIDDGLSIRPLWWLSGLAISVLGTGLAAASNLVKLARLPVLAPAKPRAWALGAAKGYRALIWCALVLLATSGLGVLFGRGVVMGFVTLGALMIGAAFLLPALLQAITRFAETQARSVQAQWFWADTRQQIPGLSLALMALLLAFATNVGVGTMVSSFRLTFTGWLDQRLASELYVRAEDQAQAEALTTWLAGRSDAVLPIGSFEAELRGLPAEIFGVADHPTYRDNWPLLAQTENVWDVVADGTGILINEQMARREMLAPGDTITLPSNWTAQIAGIYSDYGNPKYQVLIGLSQLRLRYPSTAIEQFAIRTTPDAVPGLMTDLQDRFGLDSDAMIDQGALKSFSMQVFDRTFTVSAALNVLTLGVAWFAILTSLLTMSTMRLPQLAPVWASGMTHANLSLLELARAMFLAALTLVAALPLGLALSWVLLAVINVEAFGWRLPMFLFPSEWGALVGSTALAVLLACLWPAWRLWKLPPAQLLKVFVHER
ncbi:MAG: FtsX-like permease family protein [Pseudomonadota bacterium]